jgi:hypothetical protein
MRLAPRAADARLVRPDREVDRTPRSPHVALAHVLQRSAGNAATARVLQRHKEFDTPGVGAADTSAVQGFVDALDKATMKAYQYVLHVPDLGTFADIDGHTSFWAELWAEYQTLGFVVPGMPAAFGYAIESLATHFQSPYRPSPPPGYTILTQQRRGGTNPDLLLTRDSDSTDAAWIDLTSDAQAAHIYTNKIGWAAANLHGIHIAEISYPAMKMHDFKPTPGYADDVDMGEYKKRAHFGKILTSWRRKAWQELGKNPLFKPRPTGRNDVRNTAERPDNIKDAIEQYFGARPADDRETASILMALGKSPKPYYLTRSGTRAQGEAFLIRHDPHLPTLAIPADGVPRPMAMNDEDLKLLIQAEQEQGADELPPPLLVDDEPSDDLAPFLVGDPGGQLAPFFVDDEPSDAIVAMEGEVGQQLVPVASFDFTFEGLPQISSQMLSAFGNLLNRSGMMLAFDLESGPDRLTFLATGENFAQNVMQAFMNFEPLAATMTGAPSLTGGGQEPPESRGQKRRWRARVKLVSKKRRIGPSPAELLQQQFAEQLRLMLTLPDK